MITSGCNETVTEAIVEAGARTCTPPELPPATDPLLLLLLPVDGFGCDLLEPAAAAACTSIGNDSLSTSILSAIVGLACVMTDTIGEHAENDETIGGSADAG